MIGTNGRFDQQVAVISGGADGIGARSGRDFKLDRLAGGEFYDRICFRYHR